MRRPCTEPGCGKPRSARGLCGAHYQKARYSGTVPELAAKTCALCGVRFTSKKWEAEHCPDCRDHARYLKTRPSRQHETCDHCGKSLGHKRLDARFCDDKCGDAWRNAKSRADRLTVRERKTCDHCGGPLPPQKQRFCKPECRRAARRSETYGLTKDELQALLDQHDACAICETIEWGRKGPQVDHDHLTDEVRGVLCVNCNTGLGSFRDDPKRLERAVAYLRKSLT